MTTPGAVQSKLQVAVKVNKKIPGNYTTCVWTIPAETPCINHKIDKKNNNKQTNTSLFILSNHSLQ